jgi:hypothetical protein
MRMNTYIFADPTERTHFKYSEKQCDTHFSPKKMYTKYTKRAFSFRKSLQIISSGFNAAAMRGAEMFVPK